MYIVILLSLEGDDQIAKDTRETSSGLGGDSEGHLETKKAQALVQCYTETTDSSSLNFKATFYFELERKQESVYRI